MRRILFIAAIVSVLIAAAWLVLFGTPIGRSVIAEAVEARLEKISRASVEIGALSGAPPTTIILRNVAFKDARGAWLTVEKASLRWRPFDLLRGRFVADSLDIDGARLDRRPERRDETEPFKLPDRLPNVAIRRIDLRDLVLGDAVAGRSIALGGGGTLDMGGTALRADLSLTGAASGDKAVADVTLDPDTDRLSVRLDIASPADGALAALADLGGALSIKADGDGSLRDFKIETAASLGAAGALRATMKSDLAKAGEVTAVGDFRWGPRLDAVAREIGPALYFDLVIRKTDQGFAGEIRRAAADAGALHGAISATVGRGGEIAPVSVDAVVSLADSYRPELRALLGGDAAIAAKAEKRGGATVVSGSVRAPRATALFVDAARRGDGLASLVDLTLKPSAEGPAFAREGFDGRGLLTRKTGGFYRLDNARLRSPALGAFAGKAELAPSTRTFSVDGEARIEPAVFAKTAPFLSVAATAPARVVANGALDDFVARLDLALPKTESASAARFAADLAGLPNAPRGRLVFERRGGVTARAELDSPAAGVFRLRTIAAEAKGFSLGGSARYAASDRALALDLRYDAKAPTELWPGLVVEGGGRLDGALALGGGESKLTGAAEGLAIGALRLAGLGFTAEGETRALQVAAKARSLQLGGLPTLKAAKLAGAADLSARTAVLSSLLAEANGAPLRLLRPAALRFGDGVAVEGATLSVDGKGFIAFDGAATARRWTAEARGEAIPLSAAGSAAADFSFRLDTDQAAPGAGNFRVAASSAGGAPFEIGGALRWNGRRLTIEDSGANPAFDFMLDAPALLRRGARLSLDRSGSLRGAARFRGPVEAIADFLPAPLQALEGGLDGSATLAGTTEKPALSGALKLENGAYTELVSGLTIAGIAASLKAEPAPGGSVLRVEASGRGLSDKSQTLRFEGTARLGAGAAFDGALTFSDATLSADLVDRAVVNGVARLEGPLNRLALSGDLDVKALDYRIKAPKLSRLRPIEIRAVGADASERVIAAAPRPSLAFDLRLTAANNLEIKGRGLDSVWRARLALSGRSEEPVVTGRLDKQVGTIDFSGRRFEMTRGSVVFDRLSRNDPALDIRAERRTREGVLAVITIGGRASAPKIALSSVPSAPTEDVTALVLFGKRAVELSAVESLQAAQALAQLSGFGDGATRAFGLDMLNVDFDTETGAGAVAVGKTVARGLFVSARQDVRGENGSVRVEYGVTDAFSVETELKQTGDQTISVNWKKDF